MRKLKKKILRMLPNFALKFLKFIINKWIKFKEHISIRKQAILHKKALIKVRKKALSKEKIKIAFFALNSSVWKYDGVYKIFEKDNRFEPIIVVCPTINYGYENMIFEMNKTFNFFKNKDYNVVKTLNNENNNYLDVKREINPDIIFYTNPYKGLIDDRYFITNFKVFIKQQFRYKKSVL
jgi:hypothetical protein